MRLEEIRRKVFKREKGWILLYPVFYILSRIYCFISSARADLYRNGILTKVVPPIPVISVGNIVAGGAGKTPLVEFIYRMLEDIGFSPVIVMRGYGGSEKGPLFASENADRFGDEAAIFVRRGFRVVVSKDRLKGIDFAVEKGANIAVLDDGFQQLKIEATVNIVVVDPFNPFGGNHCLPLGTLREPVSALERAHCFVLSRSNLASVEKVNSIELYLKTFRKPVFRAHQMFKNWLDENFSEASPPPKDINVFCGIGNPEQFVEMLKVEGFDVERVFAFPDHHVYTDDDIEKLRKYPNLVTTEKDAVKLKGRLPFKFPVLNVEVFGLKEFIVNRIKNVEKHEEKDEQKAFLPDGVSASQIAEGKVFKEIFP
ncbi:tetraacyldisaccharide 4'-kinase [Desulfurobacterium sp.]